MALIQDPAGFRDKLGRLPQRARIVDSFLDDADISILFSTERNEMETLFHQAMAQIPSDGAIWVVWPKKSSGVPTDLDEDWMRHVFLPTGLVDNKVCAIDDVWSGLRFVVRKEDRESWDA